MKSRQEIQIFTVETLVQQWAACISRYDQNYQSLSLLVEAYQMVARLSGKKTSKETLEQLVRLLHQMRYILAKLEKEWDQSDDQLFTQQTLLKRHITLIQSLNSQIETAIRQFSPCNS